ncbi:MAG: tRNA uridine-5-carboxymethylaminomethyl(34) synthesis enzyme MnmG, partial [Oscillospiraceae bacterium]
VELIRRPQISYDDVILFDENAPDFSREIREQVEIEIKYEGYIKKQLSQVAEMRKLEHKKLPQTVCYTQIPGLSLEAREKLDKIKPINIGQASRISGVSPADISVLLIFLQQHREANYD